ncbi:MAG TPA: alpha/beta hydrolase [Gemmataceae bacterium]|jgi:acetyl esterase/lipase|nr:alpha/beta hydrolase [Gemmataceae bacterium]
MSRIFVGLVASLLAATTVVAQNLPTKPSLERGVAFGTGGGMPLKLDLCRPVKGTKPYPVVVCIHGGAWETGDRTAHYGTIQNLARAGYFAVSVDYRLAPKYPWPAQIEDVKCAIRFLRSKAKDWDLDRDRIAALGDSAGGHLALMAGLADGFEGNGGHAEFSSKVEAVVNYFGPTDFAHYTSSAAGDDILRNSLGKNGKGVIVDLLGTADPMAAITKAASPITYAAKSSPPVLTMHGTADPLVPVEQATALHAALEKAGAVHRLELFPGAGHGWGGKMAERSNEIRLEFLEKNLKTSLRDR